MGDRRDSNREIVEHLSDIEPNNHNCELTGCSGPGGAGRMSGHLWAAFVLVAQPTRGERQIDRDGGGGIGSVSGTEGAVPRSESILRLQLHDIQMLPGVVARLSEIECPGPREPTATL